MSDFWRNVFDKVDLFLYTLYISSPRFRIFILVWLFNFLSGVVFLLQSLRFLYYTVRMNLKFSANWFVFQALCSLEAQLQSIQMNFKWKMQARTVEDQKQEKNCLMKELGNYKLSSLPIPVITKQLYFEQQYLRNL